MFAKRILCLLLPTMVATVFTLADGGSALAQSQDPSQPRISTVRNLTGARIFYQITVRDDASGLLGGSLDGELTCGQAISVTCVQGQHLLIRFFTQRGEVSATFTLEPGDNHLIRDMDSKLQVTRETPE
jgi:hypothetical protein